MLSSPGHCLAVTLGSGRRLQRRLLFVLPLVFAVGGVYFPLGVLVYWTASNAWTLPSSW